MTQLRCNNNQLTSLNIKNGQNTILTTFDARFNTNLTCIQVDDASAVRPPWVASTSSGWTKDTGASYSTFCDVAINDANFPDANFRTIVGGSAIDKDNNDELSESEIQAVINLDVFNRSIANLKGIEHFTALTNLSCFSNQLKSLDVSNNTALTRLSCYSNQLTSLDVSNNTALTKLACDNNQLSSLDVSSNTALIELYCYSNQLKSLDVSNNTALTRLSCYSNQLTSLNVSNNTALTRLDCSSNQLTNLNVKNGNNIILTTFSASSNPNLTCIQVDDVSAIPPSWEKEVI